MTRFKNAVVVLTIWLCLGLACSDDNPADSGDSTNIDAPQFPAGIMAHFGDSPLQIVIMWVDSVRSTADGYNAYKSIGNSGPVKQNSSLIVEQIWGPPGSAVALLYHDTELDSTSSDIHRYWITAVRDGKESSPSDSVVFVPSQFDINNHLLGLSPNNVQDVPLVPTFSWDAKAGASSYAISVQEGSGSSPVVWSYRTTSTQCIYQENSGITYSNLNHTTLPANTEIYWGVAALNSDNFGFATSFQDASGSFITIGTAK